MVVDVRFSFYNFTMINRLEKRADALKKKKYTRVKRLELEMDDIVQGQFDLIRQPNTFYCTFKYAEAAQAFRKIKKVFWQMDHSISVARPADPSDIQWKYRGLKS